VVDVPGGKEVVVKEKPNSSTTKTFKFDRAFGPSATQVYTKNSRLLKRFDV